MLSCACEHSSHEFDVEVKVEVVLHNTLVRDAQGRGKHQKTSTSEARRSSTCQTNSSPSVARFKRVMGMAAKIESE